jgi:hypothetical protein
MFLGALVDAGVPLDVLQEAVGSLDIGAELELRRVDRSGIDAAKVDVLTSEGELVEAVHAAPALGHEHSHSHEHEQSHSHDHQHPHEHSDAGEEPHVHGRSLSAIEEILGDSALADGVKAIALRAFRLLGHAEAKIHNVPVETIHFHEVGAIDAIADIVGVSAGCHWLAAERWMCSPLNVGGGHVHCAHGKFPVPAPATLELLRDLPVYSSGLKTELVTPTGAALLRALEVTSSEFPAMRVRVTGYGAGTKDILGQPNVLRLVVGEAAGTSGWMNDVAKERVGIIETTIDDATPELLSYVADSLLAAGASDVYRTPVQMKKGRIGTQLTVLCSPAKAEGLQKLIFLETPTLGLRYREEEKKSLARSIVSVDTEWGAIRIKIGLLDGEIVNYAPEYEDCRAVAERDAVPLKQVMQAALAAWRAEGSPA